MLCCRFSPHAWGWSDISSYGIRRANVLPTRVGMKSSILGDKSSPAFASESLLQCVPISVWLEAIVRIAYLDIETSYVGKLRGQRLFKDYHNHCISVLGLRILQGNIDSFVQFVGDHVSKAALLSALSGSGVVVDYNR